MNASQLALRRGLAGVARSHIRHVVRIDAAGARVGHPEDASANLRSEAVAGVVWAYNDLMAEWQRVYTVTTLPNGLSGLAQQFYGDPTRWDDIYNVPQNKAIQGPNPNQGLITGDKILLPHLAAPSTLANPPAGPTPVQEPAHAANVEPSPAQTTEVTTVPEQQIEGTTVPKQQGWWTPAKVVVIGSVLVAGTGLTIWAVKRHRRRTRRRRAA
jgi:hypothetical protein